MSNDIVGATKLMRAALCGAALTLTPFIPQGNGQPITPEDASAIAVEAYIYFYPLISMDLTRRQLTNGLAGSEPGHGQANSFSNIPTFPTADMKTVVRPNFDTLYSSAWLDLTGEPMVVSVPDTDGRYYLLPMLDMWTDVFASPGWRTTGTKAGNFLVAPTGWRPDLRNRFSDEFKLPADTQLIEAPTPYVWIIGRTKTDGPNDYDAVHRIQAGYRITPLSQWGRPPLPPDIKNDPAIDMKTPPKLQVDRMPAGPYFAYAAELLKLHPPHITDEPMIARIKRLGIDRGRSFDIAKADPIAQKAMLNAPAAAQNLMQWKLATLARVVNFWSMNTDTMGVYGNYYLKRAIIAQVGLGANLPEDAIYPFNLGDELGRPLDGDNVYMLHFEAGAAPPVNAFWSVTLYDQQGFAVANPLNRFALSSWMPLQHNPDGSLDLYVQNQNPGTDREANWLPAPKGPFNLTMRLYAPKSAALIGRWYPPAVVKIEPPPAWPAR